MAECLHSPIINADSRQVYKEIPIGTAAPTAAEQARVRHYFVGTRSVRESYSAGQYAADALKLIEDLHQQQDVVVMAGGGMMYIDAVCRGLDDIPQVSPAVREQVRKEYEVNGLEWLQEAVRTADREYFTRVDIHNPQRLMHALEVSRQTGVPYSTFLGRERRRNNFRVVQWQLTRPREELYERIDKRVLQMMEDGLEAEARSVYEWRQLSSLQTVGYRELFAYFSGETSKDEAIRQIQQHSRNYAKRQLTWWRGKKDIREVDIRDSDRLIDEAIKLG